MSRVHILENVLTHYTETQYGTPIVML